MSAVTPPRTRRSKAVTPARTPRTPRTPNKNYAGDPLWAQTFILAAGNEKYHDANTLCQFIEAAAKDGIDLQAMRPKGFSRTERNKLDEAWKRFVKTLRNEGPELKDLLSSAANTLALHNAGELRAHDATLRAYGVDIENLYGITAAQGDQIEAHGAKFKTLYGWVGMLTGVVFLVCIRVFGVGWVPFFTQQNASMPTIVEGPPVSAFGDDGGEFGSALVSKRIGEDDSGLIADASFCPTPLSSEADDGALQGQEESVEEENIADDKPAGGIRSDSAGNGNTPEPVDQELSPSFITTTEAADEVVASWSGEDVDPSQELFVPSAPSEPTNTTKDKPPTGEVPGAFFDSADDSDVSPGVDGGISEAQPAVSEEEGGRKEKEEEEGEEEEEEAIFDRIQVFRMVVILILVIDVVYVLSELFWSDIQY